MFSKIGYEVLNCIRLTQDQIRWGPFVNTVMDLRVP
jgi:hypothetical protein